LKKPEKEGAGPPFLLSEIRIMIDPRSFEEKNPEMQWFEKFFARFALRNLTIYLVFITGVVSAYCIYSRSDIGIISFERVIEGEWWNLFFFPFRISTGMAFLGPWVGLVFSIFLIYYFGGAIEQEMGYYRYNLYILSGFLIFTLGALFFSSVTIDYLYIISMMAAVAYIAPNVEIVIFFVLPVRMIWASIIIIGGYAFFMLRDAFSIMSIGPLMGLILSALHFFLFYGGQIIRENRRPISRKVRKATAASAHSIHKCAVCGMTEVDDPQMDFRYCVDCDDLEYCMNHLKDHTHKKNVLN